VAAAPATPTHCEWLAKIIREVEAVKVGMTRKDVEKVLQEEAGGQVQRRKSLRYQHPDCSYVKLIVTFEAAKDEKDDKGRRVQQIALPGPDPEHGAVLSSGGTSRSESRHEIGGLRGDLGRVILWRVTRG
jgi:hypothetical protein